MQHGFISTEMAEYLLDRKIAEIIKDVKASLPEDVWKVLTPRRRGVVVMMAYNMGTGFLKGPHRWPRLNAPARVPSVRARSPPAAPDRPA